MKKFLFLISLMVAFDFANAAALLKDSATMEFTGYKTTAKLGVSGTFKDVKYSFGKDDKSVKGMLKGAKAVINASSVDMGLDAITHNMKNALFANFKNDKIIVIFKDVVAGDNEGFISASITMNGKTNVVPLTYKIDATKLKVEGLVDLLSFGLTKPLAKLTKAAAGHQGLTWPMVEVRFSIDVANSH